MRRGAKAVTATVVAGRPVARKSRAPSTLAASALEQRLAEALEREAATSEILRIISQSPTDVQPVFDTIAAAALKLCSASSAAVFTFDGKLIELSAFANVSPELAVVVRRHFPRPPGRDNAATRAILTRRVVAIPDVLEDPDYAIRATPAVTAMRSVLSVPLIRNGLPLGAISVGRPEPGPFSDKQIALLQTFADQAVIAIANVRLFDEVQARTRELAESLQQQTATADVLKVISRSAFDLQTVLDTLTESACKLCDAEGSVIWRPAGDGFKAAAMFGQSPAHREAVKQLVIKPGRDTCAGRALLEGRTVHIPDAMADPEYNVPEVLKVAGNRAMLGVPLLREGAPIGVLVLTRSVARPFTEKQIALATTFADQAVIAIENVRLFNELEARNRDLTSTSEILRVISTSPTDARPVFDAIVKNAVRLCEARFGAVFRLDGGLVHLAAHHNFSEAMLARWFHTFYPMAPNRGHVSGRTILTGATVQVPDILADDEYLGAGMKASGFRSLFGVPLLRDGRAIGAIVIYRVEPGQFGDKHIELLQTFADQAVIAIENVRLFNETKEALEQQQASGEVLATISSSIADTKPVFEKILQSCERLFAGTFVTINVLNDDGLVQAVAHHGPKREEYLKSDQPDPVDETTATGICMIRRSMLHFPDIEDAAVPPGTRSAGRRSGFRSALVAPMLWEGKGIGSIVLGRDHVGPFSDKEMALLKTFADQAVIAIQNARLFREIQDKSAQLELASQHKSEFLANMSHELRTPLNAIIGFSEVLSERMFGEINEKQAEYIGDILQSGQHLLSLINDILDLSKIEAGRMELELTDFDLPSSIENTLTLVRERAVRRGIELGGTVDERLGMVRADERKVKQVLLNLLSNALKFTPEGGRIDVRAAVRDGTAEISVTDTGVGIAPEDQEAVFEEFRQVGTASKKVEGTGLGLAISRKFIELHGGRIWVKSQIGSGSTFAFTLPLR